MTNFFQRTLSGTLYVILVVASILTDTIVFFVLTIMFNSLAIKEFSNLMSNRKIKLNTILVQVLSLIIFTVSFLCIKEYLSMKLLWIMLSPLILIPVFELFRNTDSYPENLAGSFMTLLYITFPLVILNSINVLYQQNGYSSILLSTFVLIWINDSAAYLSGIQFGRHKIFEKVSPKKSWEGFAGGMLFTLIAAFILSRFFNLLNLLQWLIFGVLVVLSSVFGDFVESAMKRSAGVKDSGNIMPGHGGILDRIDSLILVSPVIFIYLQFMV